MTRAPTFVARLLGLGAAIAGIAVFVPRAAGLHDGRVLGTLAAVALFAVAAALSVSGRTLLGLSAALAASGEVLALEGLQTVASARTVFVGGAAAPLVVPLLACCVTQRRLHQAVALLCGLLAGPLRLIIDDPFFDQGCELGCSHNPFVVHALPDLAAVLDQAGSIGAIIVTAGSIPTARHRLATCATVIAAIAFAFGSVTPWQHVAGVVVAATLTGEFAAAAAGATRLAKINDALASSGDLQTTLGEALGDPSVRVLYVFDDGAAGTVPLLVERDGTEHATVGGRRAHTPVRLDGRPLALIGHSSGGGDVERLSSALNGSARLAFEVERLQATSALQTRRIAESRARLVSAGDAERRRLERDVHDGAQQFVLSLGMRLETMYADTAASDPIRSSIEINLARVRDTLDELRSIAHGLRPFQLEIAGLDGALRAIARRAPVPVMIRSTPCRRLRADIEVALTTVVQDVLASADGPLDVSVHERGGEVELVIAGAADGGALLDAADRVAVAGGTLRWAAGCLRVVVPCAS